MPTVFTEGKRDTEGVLSEANGQRSRDNITIASGAGVIAPMTVLGKITAGAVTVAKTDVGVGKGALTLADPAYGAGVKAGVYKVVIIEPAADAGTFLVSDPDGVIVGTGTVAVAFDGVVKFTLADGATNFVSGDTALITVSVAAGSGKYVVSENTATDGSEVADAVNLYGVDATSADVQVAAIRRDAVLNGNYLTYGATRNLDAEKLSAQVDLAANGIIVR